MEGPPSSTGLDSAFRKMRIVIFSHDDVTSNIIFSRLMADSHFEICAVYIGASFDASSDGKLRYAVKIARRTPLAFVTFLSFLNLQFQLFRRLPGVFAQHFGGRLGDMRREAKKSGIPVRVVQSFNDPEVVEEVRRFAPDYVVIRIGEILKEPALEAAKIETLCVHSSILPSCGGIAGEFHGIRTGAPLGTTVFSVTAGLDKGPRRAIAPLACKFVAGTENSVGAPLQRSLADTIFTNNTNAAALIQAYLHNPKIDQWEDSLHLNASAAPSYFSFPSREHLREFRAKGGRLFGLCTFFEFLRPVKEKKNIDDFDHADA